MNEISKEILRCSIAAGIAAAAVPAWFLCWFVAAKVFSHPTGGGAYVWAAFLSIPVAIALGLWLGYWIACYFV